MWKFFLATFMVIAGIFWEIWAFLLAWGAADGGKTFSALVKEELSDPDPNYTYLWVLISIFFAVFISIGIAFFSFHFLRRVFRKKITHE